MPLIFLQNILKLNYFLRTSDKKTVRNKGKTSISTHVILALTFGSGENSHSSEMAIVKYLFEKLVVTSLFWQILNI